MHEEDLGGVWVARAMEVSRHMEPYVVQEPRDQRVSWALQNHAAWVVGYPRTLRLTAADAQGVEAEALMYPGEHLERERFRVPWQAGSDAYFTCLKTGLQVVRQAAARGWEKTPLVQYLLEMDQEWMLFDGLLDAWDEYVAPDDMFRLRALRPGQGVVVQSAPRKEIRFATVLIWRSSAGAWRAEGTMTTEWDDWGDDVLTDVRLADGTWVTPEMYGGDIEEEVYDAVHDAYASPVLFDVRLQAKSLEEIAGLLSDDEDRLIARSEREWAHFEETVRGYIAWRKEQHGA